MRRQAGILTTTTAKTAKRCFEIFVVRYLDLVKQLHRFMGRLQAPEPGRGSVEKGEYSGS